MTMKLPPPSHQASYYCNKCGYVGLVGETHIRPDGEQCHYLAAKCGPYWEEQDVCAAQRIALEEAAKECIDMRDHFAIRRMIEELK